jgi:hypothetical protein
MNEFQLLRRGSGRPILAGDFNPRKVDMIFASRERRLNSDVAHAT